MNSTYIAQRVHKTRKVLIVHDCARLRRAIRSAVDDFAAEIIEAEDGSSAVSAYFSHQPEWVVMDLAMAPKDGMALVEKAGHQDPSTRMVIMSARDTDAFREAARAAGAAGYVLNAGLPKLRDILSPFANAIRPALRGIA